MSSVIIPVGIPGCGKTTTLKQLAADFQIDYICPDDIRAELSNGNAADQSVTSDAWKIAYDRLSEAIKAGQDVIIDATNVKRLDRQQLIYFCRSLNSGLALELWWFTTPLEGCLLRNASRDRVVPEKAIRRMYQQLLDNPIDMKQEGFDLLVFS